MHKNEQKRIKKSKKHTKTHKNKNIIHTKKYCVSYHFKLLFFSRTSEIDIEQFSELRHAPDLPKVHLIRRVPPQQIEENVAAVGHDNAAVNAALFVNDLEEPLKGAFIGNDLLNVTVGASERVEQQKRLYE